jgi:hypothetical protein
MFAKPAGVSENGCFSGTVPQHTRKYVRNGSTENRRLQPALLEFDNIAYSAADS